MKRLHRGSGTSQLRKGNNVFHLLTTCKSLKCDSVSSMQMEGAVPLSVEWMWKWEHRHLKRRWHILRCTFTWHNCSLGFQTLSHSSAMERQLCIISHQGGSCETSSRKNKVMVRESVKFSPLTKFCSQSICQDAFHFFLLSVNTSFSGIWFQITFFFSLYLEIEFMLKSKLDIGLRHL